MRNFQAWIGAGITAVLALGIAGCVAPQSPQADSASGEIPDAASHPAVRVREFIYESAPYPSCHASTIAETPRGPVAAWFGGTDEKHPDVGIWFSRRVDGQWTPGVEVANGVQSERVRHPCWNPVLFQAPQGPLLLFYKVGPSPSEWWGMLMTSEDGGLSWSDPRRLPDGQLGPVKNKPVLLPDGVLLCPSSTEHEGWTIHAELTPDWGRTWTKSPPLNDRREWGAIQPTVLHHPDGRLQMLCRSRQRVVSQVWSHDGGRTWGPMTASALPNPSAGIDGVTLADGAHWLVYNPTTRGRSPLVVAVSNDGQAWRTLLTLEKEAGAEFSYPAVIQDRQGLVHVTYTWKRQRVRHVVIDPSRLK